MTRGRSSLQAPQKPCFEFGKSGTCRFGDRCKYSHNASGYRTEFVPSGNRQFHQNPHQRAQYRDGKLYEWKRLLQQGSQSSRTPHTLSRFFELGLELMDGDVGASQETIKHLASENGLSFVKDLTDRHILMPNNNSSRLALWSSEIKPFFQLITHSRVIDSAVLEQEVATLYNYLIGVGGQRMLRLFGFIENLLRAWPSSTATECRIAVVELSLAVLSKILDCNTTTMVNANLHNLVDSFSKSLDDEAEDDFSSMQSAKYIEYIRQRLRVGDEIPGLGHIPQVIAREAFVLRKDFPGILSAEGPRHDNDHAQISDIRILPTVEEIISPRGEYLPTNDPSQWHIQGIHGRLDREFRLLREDTIGQLRDAVRQTLERIRNSGKENASHTRNSVRTYDHGSSTLWGVEFDRVEGLQLVLRCKQPSAVQNMTIRQREQWWGQSKRLQSGALVCVLDAAGSVIFCVVSDSTLREAKQQSNPDNSTPEEERLSLSGDKDYLFVKLRLADPGRHEVRQVLRWYRKVGSALNQHLVEFPGILLDSFMHTLTALQRMYKQASIPFSSIIAPSASSHRDELVMKAPLFARKGGIDLACVTNDQTSFVMNTEHPPTPEELASRSTLDPTQSAAILSALLREVCLIQGPPGTGKSFTGEKAIKVLLANRKRLRLGPILCVCYTNHALDQLLEHLLDDGIHQIVRIGSRSKSERLQDLNLRTVVRTLDRTKSEKSGIYELDQTIRSISTETSGLITRLSGLQYRELKQYLWEEFPMHFEELFGKPEGAWKTVNHNTNRTFDAWLKGGSRGLNKCRQLDELKHSHLFSMHHAERRLIHQDWMKSIRDPIISEISQLHHEHKKAKEQRDRVSGDVDLRCLQASDVIGVTTTGLAKKLAVLKRLRCKVMLCEEAGEVLEAHILTALIPSLESIILIGDHLQLRPQIQNYDLQSTNPCGQQYSLDMSLFERLVQPPLATDLQIPFNSLETQRRMHPSISELVRSTLYPALKDAEVVLNYPQVVGIKERLFWLHHEHLEAAAANNDPLNTSHSNEFEVEMTAALVSHLIRQGKYLQGEIAVITPYLGQLYKLRRRMESMFEICLSDRDLDDLDALSDNPQVVKSTASPSKSTLLKSVRIATVDNFQGEEAKVIIISLVRSNPDNKCGFLRTSNRINVLLSRAQHGMYIIGNSNTCRNVKMWADVLKILEDGNGLGTRLELQCLRHPETPIPVSQPDDFVQLSPESGCRLPCDKRLNCGHSCTGRCHSDIIHNAVKCLEDCPRFKKGCDHPCPLRCSDPCHEKCLFLMRGINLLLPCGHRLTSAQCWEVQTPASIRCTIPVSRTVPGCNHQVQVKCHVDVTAANYKCTTVCGHKRPCGHTCRSPCVICITREGGNITEENHGICQQRCGRNYSTCRHNCSQKCHSETPCQPCHEPCEVRCGHSRCSKRCSEPCAPCAEKECHSQCPHSRCKMPCAAPCDWIPCSKRCDKLLECGHKCPSLCGESCPDSKYCQQCASTEIKDICVDFIEMKAYQDIDLDEDPCIFPDCGHLLTVSSMDGHMGLDSHYKLNEDGFPIELLRSSEPFSIVDSKVAVCANCRGSLRNISSYGRIVRRALLDEGTKKFIAWSNEQYLALSEAMFKELEKLEAQAAATLTTMTTGSTSSCSSGASTAPRSRVSQLQVLQDLSGSKRYGPIIKTWKKISFYKKQVAKEEQPYQRVADLVKHANNQQRATQTFRFDDSVIQNKQILQATALLLKCETVVFSDFVQLCKNRLVTKASDSASDSKSDSYYNSGTKIDFTVYFQDCESLINLSRLSKHPKQEVQGHLFYAQFCVFCQYLSPTERRAGPAPPPPPSKPESAGDNENEKEESEGSYRESGISHVKEVRELIANHPSTTSVLENELDAVEATLRDGEYRQVTSEELRSVYAALAGELRGTGHWYTCVNNHPFTIGECGMPMEQARCPECGAPIGGQEHRAVDGVRHATEIESLAADINRLGV